MLFGKYNHVVETFATDTADYSFRVRILPGRVGSGDHFFDPHSSYPPLKIVSIDRIPVSDQKAWGGVFRKRLDQLPGCPRGCPSPKPHPPLVSITWKTGYNMLTGVI